MSSVWEFVKKHRNKIVFGGLLAGGAYLAHRALTTNQFNLQQPLSSQSSSQMSDELRTQVSIRLLV